jgi:hypothetical protein
LEYDITPGEEWTHVRVGNHGCTGLGGPLEYGAFQQSSNGVDWTYIDPTEAADIAVVANDYGAWSPFTPAAVNPEEDLYDEVQSSESSSSGVSTSQAASSSASATVGLVAGISPALVVTADVADVPEEVIASFINELIRHTDRLASKSNTTDSLVDTAAIISIAQQAIDQVVAETANGAELVNFGAVLTLVDLAGIAEAQSPSYNSVMAVAELVAAIEAYNGADGYDVTETSDLADVYARRVEALVELIDQYYIVDTNTVVIHVMQSVADTADLDIDLTFAGSVLNALLSDVVLATIRLNIGGELFTGWVLNTDTLAPSEYQFADRQFNSACKHGTRYLMAAEDGIYEFTEETGVESVMTYIKTGKTDFGSDLKKRIVNSYIVYSASGNMVLKVTTSEYGQLQTRNYRMVPPSNSATTDVRRFDLGRGIKSRYWQFELVGDGVDCDIDEIGMLPIVLSRRI